MQSIKPAYESLRYARLLQRFCDKVLASDDAVTAYYNNTHSVHIHALASIHLATRSYLGTEIFSALAQVYATQYPAMQWDINVYGDQFSTLVAAQTESTRAVAIDWLLAAFVARLEHAMAKLYYAENNGSAFEGPYLIYRESGINEIPCSLFSSLQLQHPYVDIDPAMRTSQVVVAWRQGLRIQVAKQAPATTITVAENE